MKKLVRLTCSACRDDETLLAGDEIADLLPQVPKWKVVEHDGVKWLERTFELHNLTRALEFVNKVDKAADRDGHRPVVVIESARGRVTVTWWTDRIQSLHLNDFIMAAKTDKVYEFNKV